MSSTVTAHISFFADRIFIGFILIALYNIKGFDVVNSDGYWLEHKEWMFNV